ncbi:MAG: hypothetical protein DWQ01_20030 [Planctomycetota bacterium]|nr:MAG: hypothetical protein DWQ01_20030 [Planctomycetota bacterium]
MKLPRRAVPQSSRSRGFTIFEVLLASSIAMLLMFYTLYSTSEMFEVVREGDREAHTHVHARNSLDRLLRDCRYSSALEITGDPLTGWVIDLTTTGSLDPGDVTYRWDPITQELNVNDDSLDDLVVAGLLKFNLTQEEVDVGGTMEISRISIQWTLQVDAGLEAGQGAKDYTVSMGGSTWIRRIVPEF